MKTTNTFKAPSLLGIDELQPQPDGTATNVENFTVDPFTGGWDNRIGYEKFFASGTSDYAPFTNQERIQSLYIWNTHNGARSYHLFEAGRTGANTSTLWYTIGNGLTGPTIDVVQLGRTIPTNTEYPTNYSPFGRYLIVTNGHDEPFKFDGDKRTDLGWQSIPGPVTPWRVDTDDDGIGNEQNISIGQPAVTSNHLPEGFVQNIGLGSTTNDAPNTYRWKVSWVNETGSESPLSSSSGSTSWTTPSGGTTFYRNRRNGVYLSDLPKGPSGTVARRIYRTMNLGNGSASDASDTYYFIAQINNNLDTVYVDYTPDQFLVNLAPDPNQSILFPAPGTRFSATFKGVLFIDGGQSNPTRIYYSNPLSPDSFSTSSYFEVGVRDGGDITGFFPYYNQLLIFRENSIEMVRGDSVNGFQISPFLSGVGTKAAATATTVPGVGVLFLGNDGIYRISGGLDGGSELKISKVTKDLVKTIGRINKSTITRATAAYSSKWREWHCYVPVDGEEKPSFGIVYHMDKDAWSIRTGFPVSCIATDQNGELVFGTNTGYIPGGPTYETGLFVITHKRASGYIVSGDTQSNAPPPTAIYKSKWHDMKNAPLKKYVKYVYLHVVTQGDNTIPITYYMDFDYTGITSSGEKMQRPDHPDQGVYDTAIFDSSVWEEGMVSTIRYPVAQKASSYFSFKVETTNDIVLVGYSIEFSTDGTSTIKGKR